MIDYLPILVMAALVVAFVMLSFVASQLLAPGDAVWLEIDPRALVPLAGQ